MARTPAQPAGGMFVLMRSRILPGVLGQPRPNLGLITGAHIDRAKLSRLVSEALPPATLSFRTDVLNTLGSAPLQHAAVLLMTLTAVIAAGLALLNLIFGLALGARDRQLTLARLSVMGYERDTRLVLLMALPAVLAAFAAAAGCALALPGAHWRCRSWSARRWTCRSLPGLACRCSSVPTWPRSAFRAWRSWRSSRWP